MATASVTSSESSKAGGLNARIPQASKPPPDSPLETQLRRFLYLSEPSLTFITGDAELHGHFKKESLKCIEEMLTSKNDVHRMQFFAIILSTNERNLLTHRENLFYVLALAAANNSIKPSVKRDIYNTVSLIAEFDEDYFSFIRYFTLQRRNTPTGLNKSISRFYLSKKPLQLAKDITEFKGYKGWKHQDLLKMSHTKTNKKSSNKATSMCITYILYGLEKAESEATPQNESQEVLEILKDAWEYRKTKDESTILGLLPKLEHFNHLQLHPSLHKSFVIWNVLIEDRLDLYMILSRLLFFYKNGFFKKEDFLKKIVARVTDAGFITESEIHPMVILIASRDFEKGGKPRDPKLVNYLDEEEDKKQAGKESKPDYVKPNFNYIEAPKCPLLVAALQTALQLSFKNFSSMEKRFMITIEVSDNMNKPCLSNKNITCLEAAVIIALCFYKSEENVTVGVFNGPTLTPLTFETGCNFATALIKVKQAAHDYVAYGLPIDWANARKKQVDVFLTLVHNVIPRCIPQGIVCNPTPALEKYQKKIQNTKLILHSLGRASGNYYDSSHSAILNLHGFDGNIAPIISAFVADNF